MADPGAPGGRARGGTVYSAAHAICHDPDG